MRACIAKRATTLRTPLPSEIANFCTPELPATRSPSLNPGWRDASTLPAAPARITSSMATGRMYDLASFIQPRMAGSSEMWLTSTRSSPSAGSCTASSVNFQSLGLGSPMGRAPRRTWRLTRSFTWPIVVSFSVRGDWAASTCASCGFSSARDGPRNVGGQAIFEDVAHPCLDRGLDPLVGEDIEAAGLDGIERGARDVGRREAGRAQRLALPPRVRAGAQDC